MKEIVILSGKGGTGKTSVAASIAILAGNSAVIADCDVDAANMHLLLKPDFKQGSDFYSGEMSVINNEICTACGLCKEKCRFDAISSTDKVFSIDLFSCEGCGYCEIICPARAITLVPRKTGKLYISGTRAGSQMVHATMEPGAENSGKLVSVVKQKAKQMAEENGLQWVIVDGSPGLGCPVVASMAGASMVLLVTEPSVSALHDLKRVNEVIKNFHLKTACVINKFDINLSITNEIREFLEKEKISHLTDIPFNNAVAKAMADERTMAETSPEMTFIANSIWSSIKTSLIES